MAKPMDHQRNAQIRALLKQGVRVKDICIQFNLRRAQIYRIAPGGRQEPKPVGPRPKNVYARPEGAAPGLLVSLIDRPAIKLSFAFQSAIQRAREVYPHA